MNIGEAARATGLSAKMIRHYEAIGLIPAALRSAAGYRRYEEAELKLLSFIRRARDLGFPLGEIGRMLAVLRDKARPSDEVKAMALREIAALEARVHALTAISGMLRGLIEGYQGDDASASQRRPAMAHG